jgi:DNA-binding IclR family transcriptional regulator
MSHPEPDRRRGTGIQSLERAAAILRLFLDGHQGLTFTDIGEALGLTASTAHRYCQALRKESILRYDSRTGQYSLGVMAIQLGDAATESLPFLRIARPRLDGLVRELDRTCVLSTWDGSTPVVLAVNDNTASTTRIHQRLGERLPVRSAQGLVFLAFSQSLRRRFLSSAERAELLPDLESIRESGMVLRDVEDGVFRIVAAPIVRGGDVVATVAVVGTPNSIPPEGDSVFALGVRAAAEAISADLAVAG